MYGRRAGGGLLFGIVKIFAFMFLWNALIPALFGGPVIGFLHALGLIFLGKILFGGRWGHGGCGHRGHHGRWRHHWKEMMEKKMEGMSPEERERFKRGFMGGDWEVNVIEVEEEKKEDEESEE